MKYFLQKKKFANNILASSLLLTFTLASPQLFAQDAANQRIRQLENALQQIQQELANIKAEASKTQEIQNELNRVKAESAQTTQKVERIQQVTERSQPASMDFDGVSEKRTMLFFRGGYARSDSLRNGTTIESRVVPLGEQDQAHRDAWYVGAGFDYQLTRDGWGFIPKTEVDAELMFEYKQFGMAAGNALANEPSILAGAPLNPRGVTVSQFTLTAAPKIKFNHFAQYKIRPWIIPAGLGIHVISPPSESITYIAPGIMFGGGVEYNIWRDFFVGVDARYHYVPGGLDGSSFSGLTTGGYVGIGF